MGRILTLILHTRHDDLVQVSHAERLYGWAGGYKEKLIQNTIMTANEAEYYQAVARFVSADNCATFSKSRWGGTTGYCGR